MSSVQTGFAIMKFIEDFFLLSISYKDIFGSIAEIAFLLLCALPRYFLLPSWLQAPFILFVPPALGTEDETP